MYNGKEIAVVIPALNEAENIGDVVASLPPYVDRIVVADNGSGDETALRALHAGAFVVDAPRRGYGSACLAALRHLAENPPDIVVFTAGDGSDDPGQMEELVRPVSEGAYDFSMGTRRAAGCVEDGTLGWMQKSGNRLATSLIRRFWGRAFSDLGPYRALSWRALVKLGMTDPDFGWTVEMQIKASRLGMAVVEIPVHWRRRTGGSPKISGTARGTFLAGKKIIWWILKEAVRDRLVLAAEAWLIFFQRNWPCP